MPPRRSLPILLSLALCSLPAPAGPPRLDRQGDPLPPGAIARLGTVRLRSPCYSCTLSPDGKVVYAETDNHIEACDDATGTFLYQLRTNDDGFFGSLLVDTLGKGPEIFGLALSADGKTIAARAFARWRNAGDDICIWDAASGRLLRRIPKPDWGRVRLTFCCGGKVLAVAGSQEGRVGWWDLASGKRVREWHVTGKEDDLTIFSAISVPSPDGRTLVVMGWTPPGGRPAEAGDGGTVWDAVPGKELWRLRRLTQPNALLRAFSPDGRFLLVEHGEDSFALREVATGKVRAVLRGQKSTVLAVAYSGDGKMLATGHADWSVCLWDTATGKLRRRLDIVDVSGEYEGTLLSLSLSADGKTLAVAVKGLLSLWDTASGRETPRLPGHRRMVQQLGFSPDGRSLLSASARTYRRWDTTTWREREHGPVREERRQEEDEVVLAVSLNANRLLERGKDGRLRLRELISNRLLRYLPAKIDNATSVFAENGKVILVPEQGTGGRDLVFLDVDSGKELRRVRGAGDRQGMTSPDGRVVAWPGSAGSEPWPHFLDAEGKVRHLGKNLPKRAKGSRFAGAGPVVSADGHLVAVCRGPRGGPEERGERIYLWETAGGKLLHVLSGVEGTATCLAFSPDGRTLAVVYRGEIDLHDVELDWRVGRAVHLWETATGRPRGWLEGHRETVNCIAWSPDGRFLASGSEDSTILVWDMSDPLASKKPKDNALTAKELTDLWEDLSSLDAAKAYRAIGRLAGSPGQAVVFLRERLRPAAPADPARVRKLVADLDDRRFAVRRRAARELAGLEEAAGPALRAQLKGRPSLEYRRRVERLLARLEGVPPPGRLRGIRAVEVLERIGSPEARRVLESLAGGAPEVRLTREARAALRRLPPRATRP